MQTVTITYFGRDLKIEKFLDSMGIKVDMTPRGKSYNQDLFIAECELSQHETQTLTGFFKDIADIFVSGNKIDIFA